MVKVDVGSQSGMVSSVSTMSSSIHTAVSTATSSLNNFSSEGNLKGKAYDSARQYASSMLTPLLRALELYSDGVNQRAAELKSLYASLCGGESLDSAELEARIQSLQASHRAALNLYNLISRDSEVPRSQKSSLRSHANQLHSKLQKEQEKLRKLYEYQTQSYSVFRDIESTELALTQGIAEVGANFASFNGVFPKPSKQYVAWAKKINTAYAKYERKRVIDNAKILYNQFKGVMDSDAAKYLSEALKFLPTKIIKSLKQSEGFEEIIRGLAKSGVKGEKAAFFVLKGLTKYDEFGKYIQTTKTGKVIAAGTKVFDNLKKATDPVKTVFKVGLKSTKTYKAIADTAKASGTIKILGKGLKFAGRATTALTFADIAVSGIAGGAKEFTKSKDVGKATIAATFSAVKSVGPLEGATIGATVGGGLPGAIIGAGIGTGIYILDKTGVLDSAQKSAMKLYDGAKEGLSKAGKAIGNVAKTFTHNLGGVGKALGFG